MRKAKILFILSLLIGSLTGCNEENKAHIHTFSNKWETNEACHWHPATCEHKELSKDLGEHIDNDNDEYCDICNYRISTLHMFVVAFVDGTELLFDPVILAENESVYPPNDPSKEGHTFAGWYDNPTFLGETYDFSLPVVKNLTLYAKFDVCTYKINYHNAENIVHNDPNGYTYGVGVSSFDEEAYDSKGHDKFYGWYFDEELTKPALFIGKDNTGDVDLYAKRSELFTLQYINWPKGIENPNPTKYTAFDEVVFNAEAIKNYPGFKNIVFKENGETIERIPLGSNGNRKIDVCYDLSKTKVVFDPNGGSIIPDQPYIYIDYGDGFEAKKVSVPLIESTSSVNIYDQDIVPIPQKEGYCFRGYFLDKELQTKINEKEVNVLSAGSTIYTKWEKIPDDYEGCLPCENSYIATVEATEFGKNKSFKYMVPYYVNNTFMSFYFNSPTVSDEQTAYHSATVRGTYENGKSEENYSGILFSNQDPYIIFINEDHDLGKYKYIEIRDEVSRIDGDDVFNCQLSYSFKKGENNPYRNGLIAVEKTSQIYEEEYSYWTIPTVKAERDGYIFAGWFDHDGNRIDFENRWIYLDDEIKVKASWLNK